MNYLPILAQAAENTVTLKDIDIVPVDFIWEQITSLTWLQAVLAISFGIVYLMYGWRIFKILVIICFALVGLFAGIYVAREFATGVNSEIWGGVLGLVVLAGISMPLMKWCVCILGAAAGGVFTGGLWYAFGLPQMYIWAGAIVGVVAGGMISFIIFKAAVMLFTSLGGSAITVVGILALLHLYENTLIPSTTRVHDLVFNNTWFLPAILMIPALAGIIMQNKLIKHSPKWEL